jgi:hypothetical protein
VEKSTLDLAGRGLDLCMGISSLKFENSVNPHFWHSDIDFGVLMYKNSVEVFSVFLSKSQCCNTV